MRHSSFRKAALRMVGLPIGLACALSPVLAGAQTQPAPPPSNNAMINLVRLLVARGTITKDDGNALIAEAEQEAAQASASADAAARAASVPATDGGYAGGNLAAAPQGTIRVPYIPEVVRDQIKSELRTEVLQQAKAEGWASPKSAAPDWIRGWHLYGDVRLRSQSNFYSALNSTQIPNFQQIVAGGPLDLINSPIPLLNTTQDRYNQMLFRARLGADVTIGPKLRVGVSLVTGNDRSAVSTNATLGGGFQKRNIFLDKAFIEARPSSRIRIIAGRFDNPFLSTDTLFDPDLRFDGAAAEVGLHPLTDSRDFNLKLRAGAFPLDFGNANFPDTAQTKTSVPQKWLFSAQAEADFMMLDDISVRAGLGFHSFVNVQGLPSAPCALYLGVTQCSTDGLAPSFVQKGNTLSMIRNIALNPNLPSSTGQAQPQLLGLVMNYDILDALAQFRFPVSEQKELTLTADYLRNLGFRRADVCRLGYGTFWDPVNNGGPQSAGQSAPTICNASPTNRVAFVGGNQAYSVMATYGYPVVRKWGEWRVYGGYKYIESDAVLDSFTDDDFHLGGTNAKGYIIGAVVGLYQGIGIGARWLSANQISGDPLHIDVLQVDMSLAF